MSQIFADWHRVSQTRVQEILNFVALSVTLSKAKGKAHAKARSRGGAGRSGRKPFAKQLSCIAEEGKRVGSVRFSLVLAPRSLRMRPAARGLCGVLMRRMIGELYRLGSVCRQAGGGLQRSGFSVHIPDACAEPHRPPRRCKLTVQRRWQCHAIMPETVRPVGPVGLVRLVGQNKPAPTARPIPA
jgi:hypothetical protein